MANLFSIFSPNKSGDKRKGMSRKMTGGTLKSRKQMMGRISELQEPGKKPMTPRRKMKKTF